MTAFLTILGLGTSNFLWQVFRDAPDYAMAVERIYFQAAAVACFVVIGWVKSA